MTSVEITKSLIKRAVQVLDDTGDIDSRYLDTAYFHLNEAYAQLDKYLDEEQKDEIIRELIS